MAAIAWYTLCKREPLLLAMWSGDKPLVNGARASRDDDGTRTLALAILALAVAAVWLLLRWAG